MEQAERPIPRLVRECFLILAVYGVSFLLPVRAMELPGWRAFATRQLISDLVPRQPAGMRSGGPVALSPDLLAPCLAWLANPLLWLGLCLVESGYRTGAVVASGLVVVFTTGAIGLVWGRFCPGYLAWSASMAMLLATALAMPEGRGSGMKPRAIDPDL